MLQACLTHRWVLNPASLPPQVLEPGASLVIQVTNRYNTYEFNGAKTRECRPGATGLVQAGRVHDCLLSHCCLCQGCRAAVRLPAQPCRPSLPP